MMKNKLYSDIIYLRQNFVGEKLMEKIIGVRFRTIKKICYFKILDVKCFVNDLVVCKNVNGIEIGKVCFILNCETKSMKEEDIYPYENFLRIATKEDLEKNEENLNFENKSLKIAEEMIKKQKLNMKLISVAFNFDRTKVLFFFTSSERVDFRSLVKKLAFHLKARVELRQIGIRDEAKMLCGIGICGRPFCCSTFLSDFHHVSIKMAKEQSLSLNPKKISGCCGKLMCCLKYEQDSYVFLNKVCPKIGAIVMSPDGEGKIVSGNPITGKYRLRLNIGSEEVERVFNRESLKIIKQDVVKKQSEEED